MKMQAFFSAKNHLAEACDRALHHTSLGANRSQAVKLRQCLGIQIRTNHAGGILRQWKAEGPDRLREKGLAWLREKTGAPEQEAPGLRT